MTAHRATCQEVVYAAEYREQLKTFEADEKAYTDKWPDHCTDCGGWGGQASSYDPSPPGISLSSGCFWEWEPCEECVCEDICPRCGKKTVILIECVDEESRLSDDHFECIACKWVEQKTEGKPLDPPEPPYCDCWEEDYQWDNE